MSCGCADVCNCFLSDTDTVSVTGNGTSGSPYQATVIPGCGLENTPLGVQVDIDPTSPIPITCGADGLSVGPAPVCVLDSDTIDFSVAGGCISGEVIIDPAPGNLLTESASGLLADLVTADTATVDFSGDGTLASPLTATVLAAGIGIFAPGMEMGFAGAAAPAGWLLEDGSLEPIATYPALFGVIGHSYNGGVSPGAGLFKLPDCQDRVKVGPGALGIIGATGGVATVTLTAAQSGLPAHAHTASQANHDHPYTAPGAVTGDNNASQSGIGGGATQAVWDDVATVSGHAGTINAITAAASPHQHNQSGTGATTGGASDSTVTVDASGPTNAAAGHTNLQPYQVGWTIIKF